MEEQAFHMKVLKKADDYSHGIKVLRISIGGIPEVGGAYLVYRGDLAEVQKLLAEVNEHFSALTSEPPISSDDGKLYA